MYLDCTCYSVSAEMCEHLMKNMRHTNYRNLIKRIKNEIPDLYISLALNLNNPYSKQCGETKTHYILVHSGIEYFIKKY